jgi:hypothetical protein
MSESKREGMQRQVGALVLASQDMKEAAAAARKYPATGDFHLGRALTTAFVVAYARAFTQSTLQTLSRDKFRPADPRLAELHKSLLALRKTRYAHTDEQSGREPIIDLQAEYPYAGERYVPFPRADVPDVLRLFEIQDSQFMEKAAALQAELDQM